MSKHRRAQVTLLPVSPLLMTESEDEFNRIRDGFDEELKPRGIVEQMYVIDIAYLAWEILRLRRCKAAIINSALRPALKGILQQLLRKPGEHSYDVDEKAQKLVQSWSSNPTVRRLVSQLLGDSQLDHSGIEAEAIRRSGEDLEQLERLLASLESRRNRALRCIADYRGGFARQLRESSDRIIDGKVLALDKPSSKKPSAAA
jgi:hypothetical protein